MDRRLSLLKPTTLSFNGKRFENRESRVGTREIAMPRVNDRGGLSCDSDAVARE